MATKKKVNKEFNPETVTEEVRPTYYKRYYGMSTRTEIDYEEALALVKTRYPHAEELLNEQVAILCEKCVVYVEK